MAGVVEFLPFLIEPPESLRGALTATRRRGATMLWLPNFIPDRMRVVAGFSPRSPIAGENAG